MSEHTASPPPALPYAVMLATPLFFSTNIIFGRYVADDTAPFVLAFLRWGSVAAILLPFALVRQGAELRAVLADHWRLLLTLGFLGMGLSGGVVYLGLSLTTATNATLIYSTAPILIILLERLFRRRAIGRRETAGIALGFIGVAIIVLRGDLATLARLGFNPGDLLIAIATLSWAGYSILYRTEGLRRLDNMSLFALVASFGALVNLPFAAVDLISAEGLPATREARYATGGIVLISSLMAFSGFQYGVRALGASVAGMFMYLMTPYGVLMAIIFLGERLQPFHLAGIVLVMTGIGIATLPATLFKRRR